MSHRGDPAGCGRTDGRRIDFASALDGGSAANNASTSDWSACSVAPRTMRCVRGAGVPAVGHRPWSPSPVPLAGRPSRCFGVDRLFEFADDARQHGRVQAFDISQFRCADRSDLHDGAQHRQLSSSHASVAGHLPVGLARSVPTLCVASRHLRSRNAWACHLIYLPISKHTPGWDHFSRLQPCPGRRPSPSTSRGRQPPMKSFRTSLQIRWSNSPRWMR